MVTCSRHFTGCQSKTGLFLRLPLLFSISLMVPCHHTCHRVCIHSFSHSPFQFTRKNSCARWKLKGFGYRSLSVQAPFVWNNLPAHIRHCSSPSQFKTSPTFPLTSHTAVLSHGSKLLLKPFSSANSELL